MLGDTARDDAARLPKRDDKKRKRKPKKKKKLRTTQAPNAPTLDPSAADEPGEVFLDAEDMPHVPAAPLAVALGSMSPRKQTIMRHKKSDSGASEPRFVSEAKEYKRNWRSVPHEADDGKCSLILSNQNMEGRTSLIVIPRARIVVYHEHLPESHATASSGTLLAHGEFEIFQLHNGDVTYLACGRSFVYPLLPKLKMLRTSTKEFVLPLVNPQRYWKIHIDTDDAAVIPDLERVLTDVVNYTNLAFDESNGASRAGHTEHKSPRGAKLNHLSSYFSTIPESPPSAPMSPHNMNLFDNNFSLLPRKAERDAVVSPKKESVTSAMAKFNLDSPLRTPAVNHLHHPRPVAHSNPYTRTKTDAKSDTSSMDSLLDEYEENISTTKSVAYSMSRPASRAVSHVSSQYPGHFVYQRGNVAILPDYISNIGSNCGPLEEENGTDEFPTASLSQYNRARQESHGTRSRKSSVSELYNAVSNWMEPGVSHGPAPAYKQPTLSHSRSAHSLASKHSTHARTLNLNETYREIYRSITLNNLASIAGKDPKRAPKAASLKNYSPSSARHAEGPRTVDPYYSKLLTTNQVNRFTAKKDLKPKPRQDGLNSKEVYKLLSDREAKPAKSSSGLGRLLGW